MPVYLLVASGLIGFAIYITGRLRGQRRLIQIGMGVVIFSLLFLICGEQLGFLPRGDALQ